MTVIKAYDEGLGAWQTVVVGKQGPQGDTGDIGPEGPQGIQGIQGEQGIAGAAAGDSVISGFVRGSGTVANTDTVTQAINKIDGNAVDTLGIYRTLYSVNGHTTAGNIAQTKGFLENGSQVFVVTASQLAAPMIAPIRAADFPTITGRTPKLRVCGQVSVNATKPSSDFTFGLYRLTSPVGGAGVTGYTWTLVTGSQASVITDPLAGTITDSASSDFDIPADGIYSIGVVTSAQIATSSNCHLSAQLQTRHA